MRRKHVVTSCLCTLLAAGLVLGACGGGDKKSEAIPLDQLESSVMRAYCKLAMDCSASPMLALLEGDVEACVTLFIGEGDMAGAMAQLVASVNAGNTAYDGVAARTCLNAMENASCATFAQGSPDPACDETFVGLLADGASCTLDEECSGGWCNMELSCPGVCDVTAGLTESCAGYRPCDLGLLCEGDVCIADPGPIPVGESCASTERGCEWGAFCDSYETGNCTARVSAGQSCYYDGMCQQGLFCDGDGACAQLVVVSQQGGACGGYEDGPFCSLAAGLGCVMDNSSGSMAGTTCEPLRQTGQDCLEANMQTEVITFYPCDMLEGLYCDMDFELMTGQCSPKKAAGQLCQEDEECQSDWCGDDNLCVGMSTDPCDGR